MPKKLLMCWLALAALSVACVPEPVDDDSIPTFDAEENLMGQIQQEGVLRVAIEEDFAPWATLDSTGAEGFTADMGVWVADALGVEVEFIGAPSETMGDLVTDGDVHLAFPMVPITEASLTDHGWSDPYWVAHQRLLVSEGSQVTEVSDLDGEVVCEDLNEDTETSVTDLNDAVVSAPTGEDCAELLRSGDVAAAFGPDVELIHAMASTPGLQLTGENHSTEGYSAMLGVGTGGFNSFVDAVFAEADREGRWSVLYERWLTPVTGSEPPLHPDMTLEEAAALFPAGS
jgi:polar amino acid transport system substrate-binding protein